jgi:hypothetical protein
MNEFNNLLKMRYLKSDYFRDEKDRLNYSSVWFQVLNGELKRWNDKKYMNFLPRISRATREIFLKTLKLSSNLYHPIPSLNKKIMYQGYVSNKDFLFKSQPYDLVVTGAHLTLNAIFRFIFTRNISLYPVYPSYVDLYSGIVYDDKNLLREGLHVLEDILNHIQPDLIVLENDVYPFNRAVVLVAKKMNIPTVEIQHGIYMSDFLPTGREVDYVFVWGQYFKDIYLKNKIKRPDQLKILGYPFPINKYGSINKGKKLVTYFGQNFELYDKELFSIKIETIRNLKKICDNLNFDFIYRPHPGDNLGLLKPMLENINFTPSKETLQETIKKGDIFISFNSTTLIEANLHSKLSIQLKSYDMPTEDLENLGACSKSVETFEELNEYLKQIKNGGLSSFYRPVKKSYIKIPSPDPGRRFLKLIEDII